MKLSFLGTGTSTGIPQIGCKCETCMSNDPKDKRLRASLLVETEDKTKILIDCGPDLRQQFLLHSVNHLDAILLTHEHYDHAGGLDDIRPLGDIKLFGEKKVLQVIQRNMHYCFSENKYPGVPSLLLKDIDLQPFKIKETTIQPIRIMHAKLPILGFRIGKMAYITDLKTISIESLKLLQGLDVLILNALRHSEHISHINLKEAIALSELIQAKSTFFTHFSHDMGKHELNANNLPSNMFFSYDGLEIEL